MCGIAGIHYTDAQRPVDAGLLERMRVVARYRGPDDHGEYIDGNVGLAFNRLSIIDLSGGHQPMSNADGTVWLIFNGEIYNFDELRDDLISRGYSFRTRSDTETVIYAWEEWGEACVEKLRGMFGLVIWDSRKRTLFGARDRLGIKPFYYYADGERFLFASEMKSILEDEAVPREIDPVALRQFLRHRYVLGPRTILKNIFKLQPGHTITVQGDQVTTRQYWDIPLEEPRDISDEQAIEELNAHLDEIMRMHLVADVPLGAFLSGGLDSSAVVGLMRKRNVADIKTFSIGYGSAESELPFAKIVAEHCQTDHHPLELSPGSFRDSLDDIVRFMDEPVGDTASIPLFEVSRFARKKVTVALSGEGSDELFGGYPIYRYMLGYETANRVPLAKLAGSVARSVLPDGKLQKYGRLLGRPVEERYGGVSFLFQPEEIERMMGAGGLDGEPSPIEAAYERTEGLDPLVRMNYLDMKTWLCDDLLVKADRMSMANALELRVPFLDHVLVEFAARLPRRLKIRENQGKYVLKKAMEPVLPSEIIYRSKKGFPVPIKTWFRGELSEYARETLLGTGGIVQDHLAPEEIDKLLADHQKRDRSEPIYSMLALDSWYRSFVTTAAPVAV